jgi:hypothetical protein
VAVIKRKPSNLFKTRIVIAVPPWGVFVVAGAIGVAIFDRLAFVTEVISLVAAILAISCAWVARRMVRDLRYQVHEVLNDIGNDELEVVADPEPEAAVFKLEDRKSG